MVFALALVLTGSTTNSASHTRCRSTQLDHHTLQRVFRAPDPPSSTFALAANTLETAACLALFRGHL
eukprot:1574983-Pleurochrysis_carterae.AAC.1